MIKNYTQVSYEVRIKIELKIAPFPIALSGKKIPNAIWKNLSYIFKKN